MKAERDGGGLLKELVTERAFHACRYFVSLDSHNLSRHEQKLCWVVLYPPRCWVQLIIGGRRNKQGKKAEWIWVGLIWEHYWEKIKISGWGLI